MQLHQHFLVRVNIYKAAIVVFPRSMLIFDLGVIIA